MNTPKNLLIANPDQSIVLIDRNRHQNSDIFILSAPVAAQVDTVHVDIRIVPAL